MGMDVPCLYKSNTFFGVFIHQIVFPFAHGDDGNQQKIVANLVDQAISWVAEFYFVAKYIVQIPKVNLLKEASLKPAFLRISVIRSPCGKASIVAVR